MNLGDYSLERLATNYLRDRAVDAARLHQIALAREVRRLPQAPRPFLALIGWWLRLTALLVRYPANPARVAAKLAAIGLPATLLGGNRGATGGAHGGQ